MLGKIVPEGTEPDAVPQDDPSTRNLVAEVSVKVSRDCTASVSGFWHRSRSWWGEACAANVPAFIGLLSSMN